MNNDVTEQEVITSTEETAEAATDVKDDVAEEHTPEIYAEYEELKAALFEAKVKLALLMCGAAKEKLDEGLVLVMGFCSTGLTPEAAAVKVVNEYPHLKLVSRDVPTFAAQSTGVGDGFSAIRSIFAKR